MAPCAAGNRGARWLRALGSLPSACHLLTRHAHAAATAALFAGGSSGKSTTSLACSYTTCRQRGQHLEVSHRGHRRCTPSTCTDRSDVDNTLTTSTAAANPLGSGRSAPCRVGPRSASLARHPRGWPAAAELAASSPLFLVLLRVCVCPCAAWLQLSAEQREPLSGSLRTIEAR